MGGDPRGGPFSPPLETGQKISQKHPIEPKQKISLLILKQQKNLFFSDSHLKTKIENFSKKFIANLQGKIKRMKKTFFKVPENQTKIFSVKNFLRIFGKMSKKFLPS